MTPRQEVETWQRLRELFDQAMEHQGEARTDFIASTCAADPELRSDLEALLEADSEAGGFMDQPLVQRLDRRPAAAGSVDESGAGPRFDEREEARSGDRFGPYRVLRPIGRGGMSTVYLAVRDDDAFQRQVVVKLVRADRQDANLERRLRTERNILGSLDHANIARLLDGGTTADGRAYFVMEYVDGLPINTHADQHQLTIDERLTLFRKVLGAVQYAHQNLIVHRDLKPSNILVPADGEPKLLDFGIAKLLNPYLASTESHATATWLRMLTPHYASPEQVRGKLVGTTSDIYSLGVLLYELLAGRLPFELGGLSLGEIERVHTELDPLEPSVAVGTVRNADADRATAEIARTRALDPRELRRQLAGDLDAIVMKALRSAPQRRYASADRFADDLLRCQRDLPVEARRGGWRYRISKLVRRHRTATAVAVSLAMTLSVGAGLFGSKHAEVLRERDLAKLERQQRETVLALLLDVLRVADPNVSRGETFTVREALETSAPKLRRQLADQPALRAELLQSTGTIYHNLGLWARARADLEEALSLRRGLFGDDHQAVAQTQSRLALVLANLGELAEARRLSTMATATARGSGGELDAAGVDLLNNQVTVLCAAQDYRAARPLSVEALALARESPRDSELATALINRGMVELKHGENIAAAELFRQSVDLLELQLGDDHPRLANPLSNLGSARRRAGDLDGALAAFEKTLGIQRAALGDEHPTLAITLNNLAGVYAARGEHPRAIDTYRQAARVLERQAGADHPRLFYLEIQIAQSQIEAGEAAAAGVALRQGIERWRPRIGDQSSFMVKAEQALGRALIATGDLEAAEALLTATFARALAGGWRDDAEAGLDLLRALYAARGTPEKAEDFARRFEAG